jgi:sarcosine oxidase subunit beta
MSEHFDVIIIGGGIMGLALSWELMLRQRRRILIVERKFSGYGGSSRNICRVRTSMLNEPMALFGREAFTKHLRLPDQLGVNTLFWRPGYALVFYEPEEVESMSKVRDMLEGIGQKTEFLRGRDAVVSRLPVLDGGESPAACLIRPDGIVHHDALLYGYRRACQRLGVELREGVEATEILTRGGSVEGVRTSSGDMFAPIVVNAAGGWSSTLSKSAGIAVPNRPVRRQVFVTDSSRPFMSTLVSFYKPLEGWFHQTLRGEVVAGIVHPDEPHEPRMDASELFLARAARILMQKAPKLGGLRIVRQWGGLYDVTPDRLPLIGPVSGLKGFVQANGDNGRGIALIPKIAELLADWLDTNIRPELLRLFDANRFIGRENTPIVIGDYYAAYSGKHSPSASGAMT